MNKLVLTMLLGTGFGAVASSVSAAQATLQWDPSSDLSVTGYVISYGTSPSTYSQEVNVGRLTSWTLSSLDNLQTYYFAVQAYNSAGLRSPYSAEVIRAANAPILPDFGTDGTPNTNRTADIIWQHADGWLSVWYMDDQARLTSAVYLDPSNVGDLNWHIVGTGDMNGDGKVDIVWQNQAYGLVVIWLMDGISLARPVFVDSLSDVRWSIAAVGDMDGDGHPDLLWQHQNGSLVVWYMAGTTVRNAAWLSPSTAPSTARLVAAADFDFDGKPDLLWQDAAGLLSVWIMNGITRVSTRNLNPSTVNTIWKVVAVSDYNRDGRPDLLFQRNDGYLAVWFMNGLTMTSSPLLDPSVVGGGKWQIVGPH